jgi:hypothetical protein
LWQWLTALWLILVVFSSAAVTHLFYVFFYYSIFLS